MEMIPLQTKWCILISMRAKKSLGQNFLTSSKIAGEIADAALINDGDTVLEIGPGKGMLTKELLKQAKKVVVIEKDVELIPSLKEMFHAEIESGQLTLIEGDALLVDLPHFTKVVANIPYYITGELTRFFLSRKVQPETIVFLVQKEVADRIARDKKESILSLSVKVYGKPKYVQTVKAQYFNPKPKVDSAVLRVSNINRDFFKNPEEEEMFFNVIKKGFGQKRKMLLNNLDSFAEKDELVKMFHECGINIKARAETLTKKDFICFVRNL